MLSKKDTLFIKGLSILLLVYHHNRYDISGLSPLRSGLRIVVWIFLFITAYGFSLQLEASQNKHPVKFVIKRLILIYVPLWICYIIDLIIILCFNPNIVIAFFTGSPVNWLAELFCVSQYTRTPSIFNTLLSGWYINMLILIIVAFPLIYFVVSKLKWGSILLVLAITWFFKWKICYEYGGYLDEYLLIVVIAILFCKYKCFERLPKADNRWRIPLIAMSVLLSAVLLCVRHEYIPYVSQNAFLRFDPLSTFMALAIISAVYVFRRDDKLSLVFEKLGGYSANIFFIHSVFYNVVIPALDINDPFLTFFMCFSLSLLLSAGIEFVKNKTDFNRKLRTGTDKLLRTDGSR